MKFQAFITVGIFLLAACSNGGTEKKDESLPNLCPQFTKSVNMEAPAENQKESRRLTQNIETARFALKLPADWTVQFDENQIFGDLSVNQKNIGHIQEHSYLKEEPIRMHIPAHGTITSCQELTGFPNPVRYAWLLTDEPADPEVQGSTALLQFIIYDQRDPTYNYDYILAFDKQEVPVALAYAVTKSFRLK